LRSPDVTQKRIALAIASLCILAEPAMADEMTGLYFGANALDLLSTYRRATLDDGMTAAFGGAKNGYAMGPSSTDRSHLSWTVDVGYMLTPNFGVELSFLDFGSFRYSGYGTVTSAADAKTSEIHLDLDVRTHGPALAVVGVLPMTDSWNLTARVGAFQAKTKSTFHTTVGDSSDSGSFSQNTTSVLASVGASFTLTSHCILRMDYLRVQKIKEKALDRDFNVDGVTAGVAYVF
jgi:opacity protein-like surface antigen